MSKEMKKFIKTAIREFLNENIDSKNKSGIDLAFKQHPELANIGTPEQYSQYLETIFPNSKIKDIVYHSSPSKIEKFRESMFGTYFSYSPMHGQYGNVVNIALLNVKNLLIKPKPEDSAETKELYNKDYRAYNSPTSFSSDGIGTYKYDASIESSTVTKERVQIKIRNPEQIHVLGSKQDIEGFKNFVKTTIKESLNENTVDALPKIIDANFFASFGFPNDFRESKKIGGSTDIYDKTTKFKGTEFSIAYQILNDGLKKLSIHFPHLEVKSNRGGAHAGMTFVFGADVVINNDLVEKLLPIIKKYRKDNFTQNSEDNGSWRLNTNNPKEIVAYIPK